MYNDFHVSIYRQAHPMPYNKANKTPKTPMPANDMRYDMTKIPTSRLRLRSLYSRPAALH